MNLSKSSLRRVTSIVAGTVLGLAGVAAFAGPASAHHSKVTGVADCVDGVWTVNWRVDLYGSQQGNQAKFIKVESTPTAVEGIAAGGDWVPSTFVTGKQTIPGGTATEAKLAVRAEWNNEVKEGVDQVGTVKLEGKCEAPKPPTTTTPPTTTPPTTAPTTTPPATPEPTVPVPTDLPGEPEPIFELTCDTMTLGMSNPADGIEFKMKFETTKGEVRETTVKPGEKKTETFSATEGFAVDWTFIVTIDGKTETATETFPYVQPDDCEDGEGGGLPVTGAAAGGVAGGAAALLAVGGLLFFMARRRKVKFTA
ncbi:hypothetical protein AB0M02_04265 [Actinoplanes sp. NPDC051861]|uniref:hypothetical protein n=1 Tax=Actinoplanes sp. NPDC051861 TaxID=3155170 RepID=UPI0034148645